MKTHFIPLLALFFLGLADAPAKETASSNLLANAQSHFAGSDSNKIHYLTLGTGPKTIAFVHGWSCNVAFWREQVPALADKAKLIVIDLPGHGESDKPQTNYTMDFFADAVLAVLTDAHASSAALVGHSMGTPIICRAYARAPEKVSALIAVDGLLRRPKMSPDQAERFTAPYRTPEYRDQVSRFFGSMFRNPGTESLRDWAVSEALKTPQHVMSSSMDAMFDSHQADWTPAHVTIPVIAINAKSPMWSAEYESFVAGLSAKTEYRAIADVGHFLMLEKPAEFNAALVQSLQKFGLIGSKP